MEGLSIVRPVHLNAKRIKLSTKYCLNTAVGSYRWLPQTIIDKIFESLSDADLIGVFDELQKCNYDVSCSELFWRRRINRLKRCCYIYEHVIPPKPLGNFNNFKYYIDRRDCFLRGELTLPTRTFIMPISGLSLYNVSLGHNYCIYYQARVKDRGHGNAPAGRDSREEKIVINKVCQSSGLLKMYEITSHNMHLTNRYVPNRSMDRTDLGRFFYKEPFIIIPIRRGFGSNPTRYVSGIRVHRIGTTQEDDLYHLIDGSSGTLQLPGGKRDEGNISNAKEMILPKKLKNLT